MADFVNEFSWSKSRHDLFKTCPRKYYYYYYGSWNGWKYNADERTRQIYRLKKLQNRFMWIGSLVHVTIENILKTYRAGDSVPDLETIEKELLQAMRLDFSRSRQGWPARKPWRLFEHEYAAEVADEQWKAVAEQAKTCLRTFWNSPLHRQVKEFGADQWLEIEELSGFMHDGAKVHVVLDFSYTDGDKYYIIDWKTGMHDLGMAELQLACYRLYAVEKWGVEDRQVETVEFNLAQDKLIRHTSEGFSLAAAREKIQSSMDGMRSLLTDIAGNRAEEESFMFSENQSECQSCQFKKVCRKWG
jgi:CRISPR/Cas system-associated exonuclease Cas4 (RecB family)